MNWLKVDCIACIGHLMFESEAGELSAYLAVKDGVTHLVVWQGRSDLKGKCLYMCDYDDHGTKLPSQEYRSCLATCK